MTQSSEPTQELCVDVQIRAVMDDPSTSGWLRRALADAILRDPIDAATDAEVLNDLLNQRCEEVLSAAASTVASEKV